MDAIKVLLEAGAAVDGAISLPHADEKEREEKERKEKKEKRLASAAQRSARRARIRPLHGPAPAGDELSAARAIGDATLSTLDIAAPPVTLPRDA